MSAVDLASMLPALSRPLLLLLAAAVVRSQDATPPPPASVAEPARNVDGIVELQVELHRRGFSCGSIDGVSGAQTVAALRAFQRSVGLNDSGVVDAATRELLRPAAPALGQHTVTAADLEELHPSPTTWLGKSEQSRLGYATLLELVAERYRASPRFLQRLNPGADWENMSAGAILTVPGVQQIVVRKRLEHLVIRLEARELEGVDADGVVILHFPVSIARKVEKRPSGELHVIVVAPNPNFTFDPEVFTESAEARELGRKLIIPPGPNNPVGLAWIGLDLPGYGIHGTPDPEKVGRTESHGCFRLANWDALTLLKLVHVGMVVQIEP